MDREVKCVNLGQIAWPGFFSPPFPSHVISGKLLNLSVPQFPNV